MTGLLFDSLVIVGLVPLSTGKARPRCGQVTRPQPGLDSDESRYSDGQMRRRRSLFR
jgi:hypothetical protein